MNTVPQLKGGFSPGDQGENDREIRGRRKKRLLRLEREDLRAFVLSVVTWFEEAPGKIHDLQNQRVELKKYFPDRPAAWLRPSAKAKQFLAESPYPLEVLAVAAWDLIKTLPVHAHRVHRGSNAYPLMKKIREGGASASDLLREGNAAIQDALAKSWGYSGKDDPRLPIASKQRSSQGERVVSGERAKSPAERRKPLSAHIRKRWPQPSGNLLNISSSMRSYWRRHADYSAAGQGLKNELGIYGALKSGRYLQGDDE